MSKFKKLLLVIYTALWAFGFYSLYNDELYLLKGADSKTKVKRKIEEFEGRKR